MERKSGQKTSSSRRSSAEKPRSARKSAGRPYSPRGRKPENGERPYSRARKDEGSDKPYYGARKAEDGEYKSYSRGRRTDNPERPYSRSRNTDSPDRPYSRGRKSEPGERHFSSSRRQEEGGYERKSSFKGRYSKDGHTSGMPFERKYERKPIKRYTGIETTPKKEPKASDEVRLNKFLSNSGICSRREADTFIQTGLVTVNGKIVTELGTKVKSTDDVRFNGERLHGEKKVYILMNKPKDFVTTLSDPHAERTVLDLISKEKCPERVYPVGRLDKATTGVLLFTNDGELTEKLTHPSHKVKKIYQVTLETPLAKDDFEKILEGLELEDGPIAADSLAYVGDDRTEIGIEIHSGRNRIVRRIFEHLGYNVKKLDRVLFAGLTKKNVRRGEWRFLEEKEVNFLKMGGF